MKKTAADYGLKPVSNRPKITSANAHEYRAENPPVLGSQSGVLPTCEELAERIIKRHIKVIKRLADGS
ncbi:hypothetical protein [Amantichitinum ursilacus]|uniref:hypothetical protein n=1 Tax=Amantichitinum ursilacus TaxID=857265 RepID=UPI00128EA778|nr:hypothetical protein [Amantichitinum ursilacus]